LDGAIRSDVTSRRTSVSMLKTSACIVSPIDDGHNDDTATENSSTWRVRGYNINDTHHGCGHGSSREGTHRW
jgi:hypothetical protein